MVTVSQIDGGGAANGGGSRRVLYELGPKQLVNASCHARSSVSASPYGDQ